MDNSPLEQWKRLIPELQDPPGSCVYGKMKCPKCNTGTLSYVWSFVNGIELVRCNNGCVWINTEVESRTFSNVLYDTEKWMSGARPCRRKTFSVKTKLTAKVQMGNPACSKILQMGNPSCSKISEANQNSLKKVQMGNPACSKISKTSKRKLRQLI